MSVRSGDLLPLHECRRLIGPNCTLDDSALVALRDQLYKLAGAVIVACADQNQATLDLLPDPERFDLEERAAILEFDGNMSRERAEHLALTLKARHRRQ